MNICNFCFSFDYNIGSNFSFHMKLHFLSYFMMFCIISIEIYMDIIAKYIENSCRMVSEKPENFSIKYYIFLVFSHKKRPPLWWSGDRQNLKFLHTMQALLIGKKSILPIWFYHDSNFLLFLTASP